MTQEIWKPVVGHEGAYEVSNLGRVRSIDRIVKRKQWDRYSGTMTMVDYNYRGRVLRPGPSESGHVSVVLGRAAGSASVHILVLEAFVGPCPEGCEACHQDDIPSNNAVTNLRWGTRSSNLYDAVRNGKKPVGDQLQWSKLRAADIPIIRAKCLDNDWGRFARLAKEYGVSEAAIRQVHYGKSWKHVRAAQ